MAREKTSSTGRDWVRELNDDMQGALDHHRAKVVLATLQTTIASGNYADARAIISREGYPDDVRDRLLDRYTDIAVLKRFDVIKCWRLPEAVKELWSISQDEVVSLALREKALLECIPILEQLAGQEKQKTRLSILESIKDSDLDAATPEVRKAAAEALDRVMQIRKSGPIDLEEMREKHREAVNGRPRKDSKGKRLMAPLR